MNKVSIAIIVGFIFLILTACNDRDFGPDVEIPDFNYPQTVVFEDSLSAYNIFEGASAHLIPSEGFHLFELSSVLFTDYAHKQRLVKVPPGTKMTRLSDGSLDYPDGTMLVKTFFYYLDERDTSLGKNIIESRLLIKENGIWNAASYLWNQDQNNASLKLEGYDKEVGWLDKKGNGRSTLYHVPNENECITCHQPNSSMTPLGPTLRNLNRNVERNGESLNQISHLQSVNVMSSFSLDQVPKIVDYKNVSHSLAERGRAYLAMNCAHCHNPNGWEECSQQDVDFRYETSLNQTGIPFEKDEITEVLMDGEMPFIGTTVLDEEGIDLLLQYIESL